MNVKGYRLESHMFVLEMKQGLLPFYECTGDKDD